MTGRLKRRPLPGTELAVERWELVPAEIGSGSWLVATGAGDRRVWAPPGVALTAEQDEPLERWTLASTGTVAPVSVSLIDVIATVPADFHGWARDATAAQLRVLALFLASAGDGADDAHTALARAARGALTEELAAVERPAVVAAAPTGHAPTAELYAAFSDTEFSTLVGSVLERVVGAFVDDTPRSASPGHALLATAGRLRHLIQVEHQPDDDTTGFLCEVRYNAMQWSQTPSDVHWLVTSRRVDAQARRALLHAVGPWLGETHKVIDAEELTSMMREHPSIEQRHPKLRVARAAAAGAPGTLRVSELASLAATEALESARRQLHDSGVVVIAGDPGTGKTALMNMLIADAVVDDFRPSPATPVIVHGDGRRIIYWDDADDEQLLMQLVDAARRHEDICLVVATGDRRITNALDAHTVMLGDYTFGDRVKVYYNQIWNAGHLHPEARSALAEPDVYQQVLASPYFTPRLARQVAERGPVALEAVGRVHGCAAPPDPRIDRMFTRIRQRSLGHIGCNCAAVR